jgi:hypothetical protein
MTACPVPKRHWRPYGNDPLPTGAKPSVKMVNQVHQRWEDILIRDIIAKGRPSTRLGSTAGLADVLPPEPRNVGFAAGRR